MFDENLISLNSTAFIEIELLHVLLRIKVVSHFKQIG